MQFEAGLGAGLIEGVGGVMRDLLDASLAAALPRAAHFHPGRTAGNNDVEADINRPLRVAVAEGGPHPIVQGRGRRDLPVVPRDLYANGQPRSVTS